MGYIKHNSIIVVGDSDIIIEAHTKAKEIFNSKFVLDGYIGEQLVSNIVSGLVNDTSSFFIGPDGSKEGWGCSNNGDLAREEFIQYCRNNKIYCDIIEVCFGGDDSFQEIVY